MAPGDMLAAASSQGGGAASWSWYVPVGLTALVIAVIPVGVYFRKTLARWAPWLFLLVPIAIGVAAIAGVEGAEEVMKSRADRGPKSFVEFIGMWVMGLMIMYIVKAFRWGRGGE